MPRTMANFHGIFTTKTPLEWQKKKPLPSHPQPVQAQGVKSWKMHLHEKSVWEVFRDEARWMAWRRGGVLAPKVTSEKNGRKVMIKVMMMI